MPKPADPALILDPDGFVRHSNEAANTMIGKGEALLDRNIADLFDPDCGPEIRRHIASLPTCGSARIEVTWQDNVGQARAGELAMARFRVDGLEAIQINVHDLLNRRRNEAQLRYTALHDPLTGLPNQLALVQQLAATLSRPEHADSVIVIIGIERFRLINDSLGHAAGDRVLIAIAERLLATATGGKGQPCRSGGFEFAVVAALGDDELEAMIRVLRTKIAEPIRIEDRDVYVSAAFGVARAAQLDDSMEWLHEARVAMNASRDKGLGQVSVFRPEMRERAVAALDLESELRKAIEERALQPWFQPIIDLEQRKVASFEALVRWQHPTRGLLQPRDFLPVAYAAGLIADIDRLVLTAACERLAAWDRSGVFDGQIAVNVSAELFAADPFASIVAGALSKTQVAAERITLEITESTMFERPQEVPPILAALREIGVTVHLDDFGTGFSSLSYLQRFPVDGMKIDRSFVIDARRQSKILSSIVALGRALELVITAEGIESGEDYAVMQTLGAHHLQGFFFAEPMPVEDAEDFLSSPLDLV